MVSKNSLHSMFAKKKKESLQNEQLIGKLHSQILVLQTENKSLYTTISDMEEIHTTTVSKLKAENESQKQHILRLKASYNESKLKTQTLTTKLHKIKSIIESHSTYDIL